jgi:hypothetical protein
MSVAVFNLSHKFKKTSHIQSNEVKRKCLVSFLEFLEQ